MERGNSLRISTKSTDRLAGWLLLLPLVVFFWLFTLALAILFLVAFAENAHSTSFLECLFGVLAFGLIIGLFSILARFLTGKLHDILSVYELSEHGVVKESPFHREEAKWSQVGGWGISQNDQTWWLLDATGRPLLTLEWHLLPPQEATNTKSFVARKLLQFLPYSLPPSKEAQLALWKRRCVAASVGALLFMVGGLMFLAFRHVEHPASEVASIGAALVMLGAIWFAANYSLGIGRIYYAVHGDWLVAPQVGVFIPLQAIKGVASESPETLITIFERIGLPRDFKDFKWLLEYVRERVGFEES